MDGHGSYHGGIVMFAAADAMLERLARIASATFEDYGHRVVNSTLIDGQTARVTSDRYTVTLKLTQDLIPGEHGQRGLRFENFKLVTPTDRQHRVEIELCPTGGDDREISELLLIVMLFRATYEFDVQMVEWLDPLTLLTTGEFLSAFAGRCESLAHHRRGFADPNARRFAPRDETQPEDTSAFAVSFEPMEVDPEQSDVRRLAIWGMTVMLATFSLPVALCMAAVNLVRGEDFRLNTQVLTLTGLVVTLQCTGALEKITTALPI